VNETKILMCLLVEGDPDRYIVPGSVVAKCTDCGVAVYVSPSGQKLQETPPVTVVCMNCTLARLEKEKEPKFALVPGQGWEIEAWQRRH